MGIEDDISYIKAKIEILKNWCHIAIISNA
jgi:hypothetical protein